MKKQGVSPYRWIILLVIVPVIVSTEMMWLTLAPIASQAEKFFAVDSFSIALLAMSYMIMFIIFSIPASWVVDKYGYRYSLAIGAILTAVFGIGRYLFIDNFTLVMVCQFMLAVGQPFILNISTKVPANWFPVSERSTAAGILIMAQYLGFALPMIISPTLAESRGIESVFLIFGVIAIISAVVALIFTREKPKDASGIEEAEKDEMSLRAMKGLLKNRSYIKVLFICFVSIGVFNTLLTLIEFILIPRGIDSVQAGVIGAVFVLAGIVGAVLLPIISDKWKKRIPMVCTAIILLIPLYIGFTFVRGFIPLCIIAGVTGFTVMGVAPILFQHGSEVAYPVQEGTSLGVILMMGQISGAIFVWLFNVAAEGLGTVTVPMVSIIVISALQIPVVLKMKESRLSKKITESI